jgi:para-nitrobenzyl esterase
MSKDTEGLHSRKYSATQGLLGKVLKQGVAIVVSTLMLTTTSVHALDTSKPARAAAIVKTSDGALQGLQHGILDIYQGIPYAAPPVGDLRWRAPQAGTAWTGVRDASQAASACVQSAINWRPGETASRNEDCLYLNVWKPRHVDTPLPVIVWFHGGSWINGAGADTQPGQIVSHGNIVVTVNYRLGALGYLSLPAFDSESADGQSSGNYGDLDKVRALQWIRQNIGAFGGDANNVTIGGQSAGAGSVCWLLASPAAAGLFNRAIIQSIGGCQMISHDAAAIRGKSFSESIGCADPATVAACLRKKSPAEIIDAQAQSNVLWRPVVGGATQPVPVLDAFRSGKFNRVPVLAGNTRHEARSFIYEGADLIRQPVTAETYAAFVHIERGDKADRVLAEYPVDTYPVPGAALAAVETDAIFACDSVPLEAALSQWVPTYTYEFRDETAPLTRHMIVPPSFAMGTAHSSELPYVWPGDASAPITSVAVGFTAAQTKLSQMMMRYWASFARAGDPNTPLQPDWPRYTAAKTQRLGLLSGGETEIITGDAYSKEHHCGFWASML